MISRHLIAVTIVGLCVMCAEQALAQKRAAVQPSNVLPMTHPVAVKILAIEKELDATVRIRNNIETIYNRYYAPDWYDIGPHADIYDRKRMIEIVKNNSDRVEKQEYSDVIIRLYGSVVVITALTHEIGKRENGTPYDEPYRWTDVFYRRNGRWQIVVSQSTLFPERH